MLPKIPSNNSKYLKTNKKIQIWFKDTSKNIISQFTKTKNKIQSFLIFILFFTCKFNSHLSFQYYFVIVRALSLYIFLLELIILSQLYLPLAIIIFWGAWMEPSALNFLVGRSLIVLGFRHTNSLLVAEAFFMANESLLSLLMTGFNDGR